MKLGALLVRAKPRDLYDMGLPPRQGVESDLALVEHKLAPHDRQWEGEVLEEAVENLRAEWEWDLRPLLL